MSAQDQHDTVSWEPLCPTATFRGAGAHIYFLSSNLSPLNVSPVDIPLPGPPVSCYQCDLTLLQPYAYKPSTASPSSQTKVSIPLPQWYLFTCPGPAPAPAAPSDPSASPSAWMPPSPDAVDLSLRITLGAPHLLTHLDYSQILRPACVWWLPACPLLLLPQDGTWPAVQRCSMSCSYFLSDTYLDLFWFWLLNVWPAE